MSSYILQVDGSGIQDHQQFRRQMMLALKKSDLRLDRGDIVRDGHFNTTTRKWEAHPLNEGVLIWDGKELLSLDTETFDRNGSVPREFSVPFDFPIDHWRPVIANNSLVWLELDPIREELVGNSSGNLTFAEIQSNAGNFDLYISDIRDKSTTIATLEEILTFARVIPVISEDDMKKRGFSISKPNSSAVVLGMVGY